MSRLAFALECDKDVADDIAASFRSGFDAKVSSATKRNLDGAAETVIQLVELAFTAGSTVLPLILPWVRRNKVRKIRLGDLEIENPTPEQVETLWRQYLSDHHEHA